MLNDNEFTKTSIYSVSQRNVAYYVGWATVSHELERFATLDPITGWMDYLEDQARKRPQPKKMHLELTCAGLIWHTIGDWSAVLCLVVRAGAAAPRKGPHGQPFSGNARGDRPKRAARKAETEPLSIQSFLDEDSSVASSLQPLSPGILWEINPVN